MIGHDQRPSFRVEVLKYAQGPNDLTKVLTENNSLSLSETN